MTQSRLLSDRYELGELLGRGGMAEVHLGRDIRLGREVAIKILRADLARDPTFQTRFRREAQAAASLNHPAIVAVYDTGEDPDGISGPTPFIVMELVEGRTLREVLRAEGRLHPQRAMEITADVCAALDFSHRNGIVHRDVKPGNVMITRAGAVKVMDFGIARAVTDSAATVTATAQVIGTAQYLSPEQARGENVDARSDVYSTGCMLYELLAGSPPFTGDSPVAVAYQHVRENAAPPSSINPDVPQVLDQIVLKAMAKNPLNRYQSAADMRADLGRAMSGRTVMAESVMSAEERTTVLGATGMTQQMGAEEPERSHRNAYIALAIAVVLILAGAGFGVYKALDHNKKKDKTVAQVSVPSVQDLTKAQAQTKLKGAGLKAAFETATSTAAQKNRVTKQVPDADTQVNKGTKVTLTIGQGPDTVQVPPLHGDPRSAAEQILESKNLKVGTVHTVHPVNGEASNTVISSDPQSGSPVSPGSSVDLYVSNGYVQLPNLYGLTLDAAINKLVAAGFTSQPQHHEKPSTGGPPGTVVGQQPQPPNDWYATDTVVTLAIAEAKATPTPTTAPPSTTPPPSSSSPPSSTTPTDTDSPIIPVGPGQGDDNG
jgi:serine/threonine-protein kinase